MRVIDRLTANWDLDPWLSVEALSKYGGLSVRSLRAYLTDPHHPIPHYRMKEPHVVVTASGKRRTVSGKILVRRSDFDRWMEHFNTPPPRPPRGRGGFKFRR
jgi:hypothetical protein